MNNSNSRTINRAPRLNDQVVIETPFHDVDAMGIVWHGNYAKYFELARCKLLEQVNFGYESMGKSEYIWPIVHYKSKFIKPLKYKQKFKVSAELTEWEFRLKIDYLITDLASGAKLSRGSTIQVAVYKKSNEICAPLPEIFRNSVDKYINE